MMTLRWFVVVVGLAMVAVACASSTNGDLSAGQPVTIAPGVAPTSQVASSLSPGTTDSAPTMLSTSTTLASPTTITPTTLPAPTRLPAPTTLPAPTSLVPTTQAPAYVGAVREIDAELEAFITPTSFREGCPVGLAELRLVEITYVNYEGDAVPGRVIVHRDHADGIAQVFEELFDARFPMQSVELVDTHGGDDQISMQANNTSAFNCREVAYRPGVWSNHAVGTAIDINPLVNPYVKDEFVDPEIGRRYVDRTLGAPGMIVDGDVVVQAFERIGWSWGGYWTSAKDYQHFSASGT